MFVAAAHVCLLSLCVVCVGAPFEPLRINKNGRYTDTEGNQRNFPTGFFDVSVRQLLEIG